MSSPERPLPHVALNNLDLLDESGTPNPYAAPENFFDESLEDATLDEIYADTSRDEPEAPTHEVFYEGFAEFRKILQARRAKEAPDSLVTEDKKYDADELVGRALPYLAWRITQRHGLSATELSLLDRFQNGAAYLTQAAANYDGQASFIAMFSPMLDRQLFRPESGGVGVREGYEVSQGDLIRVPSSKLGYHHVKYFHRGRNFQFGRELDVSELAELSNFTAAEFEEYESIRVEHIPFHHLETDTFTDTDPATDPYEAAARKVAHDGITTALNLLTAPESEILVARSGLNRKSPAAVAYSVIAEELGAGKGVAATNFSRAALKLRKIPDIEEIIQGTALPHAPEATPASETPLVHTVRALLNDGEEQDGIISELSAMGIGLREILEEAGLHPKYAAGKIEGRVFTDDNEAVRLLETVSSLSQKYLHLSLYELVPGQTDNLDTIFALLEL